MHIYVKDTRKQMHRKLTEMV